MYRAPAAAPALGDDRRVQGCSRIFVLTAIPLTLMIYYVAAFGHWYDIQLEQFAAQHPNVYERWITLYRLELLVVGVLLILISYGSRKIWHPRTLALLTGGVIIMWGYWVYLGALSYAGDCFC